jgi:hypothetical protein
MEKIIIGIDPDIEKSGYCVLKVNTKEVETTAKSFHEIVERFRALSYDQNCRDVEITVVVEASWIKGKNNWHLCIRDTKNVIAAKGYSVGQNHQTGILICEMARSYGLKVVEHLPLFKCWNGKDRKITDEEIKSFMPIKGRTNQESRDAALLAWVFSGLPIRVKPVKC